ncbi:hypothetical protein D3C71_27130 [compost metagenome]
MNIRVFLIFLLSYVLFSYNLVYGQQDTMKVKSIEEAINSSLKEFRQKMPNDKMIIYNIVEMSLNQQAIQFAKNDLLIENSINAKMLDYSTDKYVFKFLVSIENGRTFIKVIQWKLEKKSNKKIELLNLMSGQLYEVIP